MVPAYNALTLAKISVVLDEYIEEYHLDALALRCWNEMETYPAHLPVRAALRAERPRHRRLV